MRFLKIPRLGLLSKFALASIVPIVLLGLLLAHYLKSQIEDRTLSEATRAAVLIARAGIQPQLKPSDLENGLTPARMRRLTDALHAHQIRGQVVRIKIWNRALEVVYSDERRLVGKRFPLSKDALRDAYNGEIRSQVSDLTRADHAGERKYGQLLEVYVPLQFQDEGIPAGVFDVYLPYKPIAEAIDADTRTMYVLLLAGLGVLYATLFRIVAGASRRLRAQARELEHQAEELRHQADELRRHANEKEQQALHDALTGLPNRTLFHDRIGHAILAARRTQARVGVLIMDLDRFKEINDTLGHHCGDLFLKEFATRLSGSVRSSDTIARLGGDEFGLVFPEVTDVRAIQEVAEKLRQVVEQPFVLEGLPLGVEASMGLALYPDHGDDVETLLQRADVAMYVAKEARTGVEFYKSEKDGYSPERLTLVAELRRAIENRELTLHYQPKASLRTGSIESVEALVRWQHPERGLLPPDAFVPVAQHTGLIRPFTLYVLDEALKQCRAWHDEGLDLAVAVNLSMRNLLDAEFPATVGGLLAKWGVEARFLNLEMTEGTIMADPFRAMSVLRRLSDMGVRLAIDDFGTGYSSLAYLKRLTVNEIKIDRSFVMNMTNDENDAVIVRSTIDLGRNLGLEVVAEGVESQEAWAALEELGCDLAQGFYLSRPVPAEVLTSWLRERRKRPERPLRIVDGPELAAEAS
ncbi:MAG: EAL domain-containing protein [Actinomycetota bacterium]|nr:EAL domain-containing protein [Actinomycetota bacterium]